MDKKRERKKILMAEWSFSWWTIKKIKIKIKKRKCLVKHIIKMEEKKYNWRGKTWACGLSWGLFSKEDGSSWPNAYWLGNNMLIIMRNRVENQHIPNPYSILVLLSLYFILLLMYGEFDSVHCINQAGQYSPN